MGTACKTTNMETSDDEDQEINVDDDSRCGSENENENEEVKSTKNYSEDGQRGNRITSEDKYINKNNNCDINGYGSDQNSNNTELVKVKSIRETEKHYEEIRRHYEQTENLIRNYQMEKRYAERINRKSAERKTDTESDENHSEYDEIRSRSNSPKSYFPGLIRGKSNDRSDSSSPLGNTTAGAVLPFSISRLLSREKRQYEEDDRHSDRTTPSPKKSGDEKNRSGESYDESGLALYSHPAIVQFAAGSLNASSRVPQFLYNTSTGVIRVPAHRPPLPGSLPSAPGAPNIPALGSPFPWLAAMDPSFQRSAAAAAFASQVVKERLTGKLKNTKTTKAIFDYFFFPQILNPLKKAFQSLKPHVFIPGECSAIPRQSTSTWDIAGRFIASNK